MVQPDDAATEEAVQTAVRGMFGRDSLYVALWGVQLAAAALFTPFTTRILGAERFGEFAAAASIMQVLFALATMGLQAAVQRYYAEPNGAQKARQVLSLAIVAAAVITAAVDATGPLWAPALGFASYHGAVRMAVLWAGSAAITDAALGLLRSRDRLLCFSIVSLVQSVVAELLSVALVLLVHRTAATFVLGELLAQLAALSLALVSAPPARVRLRDLPLLRSALRYSVPLLPSALAAFVLGTSDRLVIQRYLGAAEVGRYQVAYNLGALVLALLGVMNTAWMPRIFAIQDVRAQSRLLAVSRDAVRTILLPVVLGMSLGAPVLLRIWVPPSYHPDELLLVVIIVLVSAIPYAGSFAYTRVLLATDRTRLLALSFVGAAAVNLVLNIVLVPVMGLLGSAAATWVAYGVLSQLNRAFATRVLVIAPTTARMMGTIVAASGLAFATVLVPTSAPYLVLRLLLGTVCLLRLVDSVHRLASADASPSPSRLLRRRAQESMAAPEA